MRVFACTTHVGGRQELLENQLAAAGIFYAGGAHPGTQLGHGKSWRPKLEWYRDMLGPVPSEEEFVVLTDAWDVVFQGAKTDLETTLAFHLPSGGVLVSGEKNCWPDQDKQVEYPMGPTPWMFVNSGGIVGRAGDLHAVLDWGLKNLVDSICEDDQRFWTSMFLRQFLSQQGAEHLPSIHIDYHCQVFQTMFLTMSGELHVKRGKLFNSRTVSLPFFLHWNGGSNWPDEALQQLEML